MRRLALAVLGGACFSLAWSLAIPLLASPDEPAQMFAAAALADGQVKTTQIPVMDLGLQSQVDLPLPLTRLEHFADCIVTVVGSTAACLEAPGPGAPNLVTTQFGRYPPTYYAVAGLPTKVFDGIRAVRAMRMLSAALTGALVGLGLWVLSRFHRSSLALAGGAVALSPAVFGLTAVINASALEVSAAFATWCGLSALLSRDDAPPALLACTAGPLALFLASRPVSPLWAAIALVVTGAVAGRARLGSLLRSRATWWAAVPVGVAAVGWIVWTAIMGTPPLLGRPPLIGGNREGLRVQLEALPDRLQSTMGNLLAVPAPLWILGVYTGALVVLGIAAWRWNRRGLVGAVVLVGLAVVSASILELKRFDDIGPWWQARYSVPLLIGMPLLLVSRSQASPSRRARSVLGAAAVGVHLAALAWAVHRFGVVPGGGWSPSAFEWRPPHLWLFLGLVVVGAWAVWLTFRGPVADRET